MNDLITTALEFSHSSLETSESVKLTKSEVIKANKISC